MKKSSRSLPFLAVLVLVGTGVVFLGPQLTGLVVGIGTMAEDIFASTGDPLSELRAELDEYASGSFTYDTAPSHLYPVAVNDYNSALDPGLAFGSNDPNYAVLSPNVWVGPSVRADSGVSRCPSGFVFNRVSGHAPFGHCNHASSTAGFTGWLSTSNQFKLGTLSASRVTNPVDITSVQVSASDFPRTLSGSTTHSRYVVFVRAKCTGSTGAYVNKYVGTCTPTAMGVTCTKTIGRTGCTSGKWTVNRVVVGNAETSGASSSEYPHAMIAPIHWIRLVK